jgi:hypothetical protein
MPKTKAELLEENAMLIKNAVRGWAVRLEYITKIIEKCFSVYEEYDDYKNQPQLILNIVEEMRVFSGLE